MLDALTLDQLRMLVTAVDEGSFSAAARKLRRVQSAVSHAMKSLEMELGIEVWNRSRKVPTLTPRGRAVLAAARRVLGEVEELRGVVQGLSNGLEASVSVCVDASFPLKALVTTCCEFARAYPSVELRVHTETMSSVVDRVADGTCQIGVAGPFERAGYVKQHLTTVKMVPVVSANHPLAEIKGRVRSERLEREVQVVLSERGSTQSPDQGVLSPRTWRVADLTTKLEMLRAGLGWGNMPLHMVRTDLASKKLVRIRPGPSADGIELPLAVVHERGLAMGPATRWLVDRLAANCKGTNATTPTKGQ
jgi:DNA-binding transcriptional LysR family regulator